MKTLIAGLILLLSSLCGTAQKIYLVTQDEKLYSFDLANCDAHYLADVSVPLYDIGLTSDGKLWADQGSNTLYQVDTANGQATIVGSNIPASNSMVDLDDTTLLVESNDSLFKIKTTDGSTKLIGYIGYSGDGDLAWYDDDLYMVSNGLLIRIILDSAATSVVTATPVNSPNQPIPLTMAMVTTTVPGGENALIAFSDSSVYRICPFDGSYQLLCPSILHVWVFGAAATRLPVQNPMPVSCTQQPVPSVSCTVIPNVFTPNNDGFNDTWQLNAPGNCFLTVDVHIYNRWGSLVYQSKNYQNNWDGNWEGKQLPDATYYYVLDEHMANGNVKKVTGNVTIMR